ncbi:MAG: hypothetical protein DHS20C02_12730 [Micavibrio sp.]|nr:MAG: hypothetical protein DHS20C02_12730 [Micavibrio sp.]
MRDTDKSLTEIANRCSLPAEWIFPKKVFLGAFGAKRLEDLQDIIDNPIFAVNEEHKYAQICRVKKNTGEEYSLYFEAGEVTGYDGKVPKTTKYVWVGMEFKLIGDDEVIVSGYNDEEPKVLDLYIRQNFAAHRVNSMGLWFNKTYCGEVLDWWNPEIELIPVQ